MWLSLHGGGTSGSQGQVGFPGRELGVVESFWLVLPTTLVSQGGEGEPFLGQG